MDFSFFSFPGCEISLQSLPDPVFRFYAEGKHDGIQHSKDNGGTIQIENQGEDENFPCDNQIVGVFEIFVRSFPDRHHTRNAEDFSVPVTPQRADNPDFGSEQADVNKQENKRKCFTGKEQIFGNDRDDKRRMQQDDKGIVALSVFNCSPGTQPALIPSGNEKLGEPLQD